MSKIWLFLSLLGCFLFAVVDNPNHVDAKPPQEPPPTTTVKSEQDADKDAEPSEEKTAASKALAEELDAYIEQVREQWKVPGIAVGVVKDGEVILCKGFGVCEVGDAKEVNKDTLFAIASNTKAFTSAALAILVDEGKLDWDDRVNETLPWLKLSDQLATNDLRIRDLLCHRSGLGTFSGDAVWWCTDYSTRQVLEKIDHLELATPFRAAYGYSNLMFLAAGQVIEAVSGQPYAEFIEERILVPVGMNRTVVSVRDLLTTGNFATPHKTHLEHSQPIVWMNWDAMAAGGGVISSVADMTKWLKVQLAGGKLPSGKKELELFSKKQAREMWHAHTPIPVSEGYSTRYPSTHFRAYGLGWVLADYQGRKTVGHGGGYDGMYSQVMLVPEENLGIVVLTNSMTSIATPITYTIVDKFLGVPPQDWSQESLESFRNSREEFQRRITDATTAVVDKESIDAVGTSPSHRPQDYTGTYRCPLYGDASVELVDGSLTLHLLPSSQLVADLTHLHYDTFLVTWRKEFAWFGSGTANFLSDDKGVVQRIELNIPNDDIFFDELQLRRVDATK